MLPACIVRKADSAGAQGPLLCRGSTTLEANTSYARSAEAAYGPAYQSVEPAMVLADLAKQGIQVLPDTVGIGGSTYCPVVLGPNPPDSKTKLVVGRPGPHDVQQCIGATSTDKVPTYFDATDPKQGKGGAVYCLPGDIRPASSPTMVEPDGQATAQG